VSLLLIRHALAGHRDAWQGDDRIRPLEGRGGPQAEALVDALAAFELDRIVSSPFLRCVQSVEPLAEARGLELELDGRLGADRLHDVTQVLEQLAGQNAAVCTHGDLPWLGDRKFEKGSTWVLDARLEPVRYLPPPA
jgi:phosphohistidine phosphatase SixA